MSKQQTKKIDLFDVTAVKWWWKADDKWTEYKPELQPVIEFEFQRGTKRIKVDNERFIDTSLTVLFFVLCFKSLLLFIDL
jgi:hypothetical protein